MIIFLGFEDANSDQYIFCDLSASRSGYRIRSDKKASSYTTLRDLFRNTLKPHVCDINKYGLHSLRTGSATRATNFGITGRLFKRHGRRRSETAKNGYVKDALQNRLSVLQCLGLSIFEKSLKGKFGCLRFGLGKCVSPFFELESLITLVNY